MKSSLRHLAGLVAVLFGAASVLASFPTTAEAADWKPNIKKTKSVDVAAVKKASRPSTDVAQYHPKAVTWPVAADTEVDLSAGRGARVKAAGTPVSLKSATGTGVGHVRVLDRAAADALVGLGLVTVIDAPAGIDTTVSIDYSAFADAAGGGFGQRLQLVTLPACALTTPSLPQCQGQTPLNSTNEAVAQQVTAVIPAVKQQPTPNSPGPTVAPTTSSPAPSGAPSPAAAPSGTSTATPPTASAASPAPGVTLMATVVAAVPATGSDQSDYSATSLKSSSTWDAGDSTGEFTWSYALGVPDVASGAGPGLQVAYSSGGTDGGVSNTNNQASWVGEGFDVGSAFIERKYQTCYDDRTGAANSSSNAVDQCWWTDSKKQNDQKWDNAFLSMTGHAGELVRVGNTNEWRLQGDDGTRVAKIGDTNSNNEYWRVTTPDGTQYYFGKGKADASGAAATNSVWKVPVSGNHSGEPGYNSTFSSSFVSRPWRWNLDYVVSPTGATATYYYVKETNKYKKNLSTSTSYDRGGYLSKIQYGERQGSETVDDSPAKVTFTVEERCDTAVSSSCKTATPTATTAKAWPDVPMDAVCDSSYCPSQKTSPTFFTRKRLVSVDTFTRDAAGTAWQPVDSWAFTGSFPKPNDGAIPSLWLSSIQHTGKAGAAIILPAVTLKPGMLISRISGSSNPLEKPRLEVITSETGQTTTVEYSQPECTMLTVPSAAQIPTNTTRCMPVYYSSGAENPTLQWFNKYVVDSVTERDTVGDTPATQLPGELDLSRDIVTSYTYSGGGAWRYDDSPMTKTKYRTWGVWRGYGKVTTTIGTGPTKSVSEDTFFRGMNGDRASASGGTKAVSVTDSTGASWADDDWLSGIVRETRGLKAVGGGEDSGQIMDPRVANTQVSGAVVTDGRLTARQVSTGKTVTRQALAAGGTRKGSASTVGWDAFGQATLAEDAGDLAVSGDETCTRTSYGLPVDAATGPIDRVVEISVSPGDCSGAVDYNTVVSASRNLYGTASITDPIASPGALTEAQVLQSGSPRTWVATSKVTNDAWGRAVTKMNALGHTSTIVYIDTAGGRTSSVATTSPDPDGAGPLTPLTSTITFNTQLSKPIKTVGPGGETTEATVDALGRTTAIWKPGRDKGTQSPSTAYAYSLTSGAPSTVTTNTLLPSEAYSTSITLLDSMLRTRQVQSTSAGGDGRLISDTRYDSRGNVVLTDEYYNAGVPSTTLVQPTQRSALPTSHRMSYDYEGRVTQDYLYSHETLKWVTATSYGGDRTSVTPPVGGTPTTVVTNIDGDITQRIQHLGPTTDSAGVTTNYSYDLLDQLTGMADPNGNKWTYGYDLMGNQVSTKDPDKGPATSTYNALRQLTASTDARGVTLKYFYDATGRPIKTTKADGTTVLTSTSYDTVKKGLVASTSRHLAGGTITDSVNSYDSAGRATSTSITIPAIGGLIATQLAGTYTSSATYNPDGSIATQTLPAAGPLPAETLTHTYLQTGLPNALTGTINGASSTYVNTSLYYDTGELQKLSMGATSGQRASIVYTYDDATHRLQGYEVSRQGQSAPDEQTNLSYDPAGNITGVTAALAHGQVDNQCFSYDHQQQLTEAWTPDSSTCDAATRSQDALGGPAPYWNSWSTNTIGKTTSRTDRTKTTSSTTSYSYPDDGAQAIAPHFVTGTTTTGTTNGTAHYTADQAGNTIARPGQTLVWDDQNQLTEVKDGTGTIATMAYAADGSRLLRQQAGVTTLYLGGTELSVNAAGTVAGQRYYSHAGQTVAVRTGTTTDTITTLISDWQGTTHHQVNNGTGALTTAWQSPYGEPRGTTPTGWTGDRGFVGGTKDATGLTRIGARDYDPILQRFVTVDPQQAPDDPLQWNPYIYANNSPITKADPTGLEPFQHSDGTWSDHGTSYGKKKAVKKGYVRTRYGDVRKHTLLARSYRPSLFSPHKTNSHTSSSSTASKLLDGIKAGGGAKINELIDTISHPEQIAEGLKYLATHPDVLLTSLPDAIAQMLHLDDIAGIAGSIAGGDEYKTGYYLGRLLVGVGEDAAIMLVTGGAGKLVKSGVEGVGALRAANTAEKAATACFVAGTPVQLADGTSKPIEQVAVGDKVTAYNLDTGHTETREVVRTFVHHDVPTYDVTLASGEKVTTTQEHPFWVEGHGWTPATQLKAGDRLQQPDGSTARVQSVRPTGQTATVYNFEVEGLHDYYVQAGNTWILVHNACVIPWSGAGVGRAAGALERGAADVTVTSRSQAEEIFLGQFQGRGYVNTTGMSGKEVRDFLGSKSGTYHWDTDMTPGLPHSYSPHLQIHNWDGTIQRIFYGGE